MLTMVAHGPRGQGSDAQPGWVSGEGFRYRDLPRAGAESAKAAGFVLVPPATTGLTFTNRLDALTGAANRVLYNGAGLAVGDYDGDGRPDLFLCDLSGQNALYRNLGGWRFQDVTAEAGLGAALPASRGAVFADLDGDRKPELLVSVNGRGVVCWRNDGHGHFLDATAEAGTAARTGATTLALADVDGDGDLDLYVTNYRQDDIRDRGRVNLRMVQGRPILPGSETNRFVMLNGRLEESGQPDQLYLNDGAGRFRPVPWTEGAFLDEAGRPLAEAPADWGLTATFRDLNGDGAPDLYVCNDYWTPDRCWINEGTGRFRAAPDGMFRKTPASSMGVDFADVDGDGRLDGFMVDMLSRYPAMRKRQGFAQMLRPAPVGGYTNRVQVMRNTLQLSRGDGTYAEVAAFAGLTAADWAWSPVFLDVDLDGHADLLIGAGHFRDVQDYDAEAQVQALQHAWTGFATEADRQKAFTRELMEHYLLYPLLELPIGAFRNRGDGRFEEVTADWGLQHPGVNQGLALADFDGDGALDLAVNRLNAGALLLRRQTSRGYVAVRLRGGDGNGEGVGARVTLRGGSVPSQTAEVISGGRYQSGSQAQVEFATGDAVEGLWLEVTWRDGRRSQVAGVRPYRLYEIDIAGAQPAKTFPPVAGVSGAPSPFFVDVSEALGHQHTDPEFNDLDRQPLLPFRLSQAGPGVAWIDLDRDGDEDLVVGGGLGTAPAGFENRGAGRFGPLPPLEGPDWSEDTAGLVGWVGTDGVGRVLATMSGYETATGAQVRTLALGGPPGRWSSPGSIPGLPPMPGAGALALGDPIGEGRLVAFVAGGPRPGQYPLGAPSWILRQEGAGWRMDAQAGVVLGSAGLVNGAVWTDLDGDGHAELVLACEWGPIRVFRWRQGGLVEETAEWGLNARTGWWKGVTAVDLDGDGRMDLVASNWGLNSPYEASAARPLTLVYGQLAQPGVVDLVETEWVDGVLAPRRQRPALAQSLPFLLEWFPSHRAYSEATLEQVLGERGVLAKRVSATTLASMAFLNTGRGFRAIELPREAQWAPGFGLAVADFDGDGREDLFLGQNQSAMIPEVGALDSGMGLWMRGDGRGGLHPVPAGESGLRLLGDQRGAAVADMDGDGRVDLVVGQNGGTTRLFHNAGGRPGLRVRLSGPLGNPCGYGVVLRLESAGRIGPAREVHGGSGYWSQDGPTTVLAVPEGWEEAVVAARWPGGRVTRAPVPRGAREIVVAAP